MAEALASILEAFTAHRKEHRKGAYPAVLRRRAVEELTRAERLELGSHLGLSASQVDRWEALKKAEGATSAFFEVRAPEPRSEAMEGVQVEVALRGGSVLRLRGKVDATVLRILVATVQEAGGAA